MKTITKRKATQVTRSKFGPWIWPDIVQVMISDSFKVLGPAGLGATAANGDPLPHAYAVNFLETLYRAGFVVCDSHAAGRVERFATEAFKRKGK